MQGGRGRDFCVATDDGIDGNDVANGGPGRDVYDADAGDVLVSVENGPGLLDRGSDPARRTTCPCHPSVRLGTMPLALGHREC